MKTGNPSFSINAETVKMITQMNISVVKLF